MNFQRNRQREMPEINLIPMIDVLLVILIFVVLAFLALIRVGIINFETHSERHSPPFLVNWVACLADGKRMNIAYWYVNVNGDYCWRFVGTRENEEMVANECDGDLIIDSGAERGRVLFFFKKTFTGSTLEFKDKEHIKISNLRAQESAKLAREDVINVSNALSFSRKHRSEEKKLRDSLDLQYVKNLQKVPPPFNVNHVDNFVIGNNNIVGDTITSIETNIKVLCQQLPETDKDKLLELLNAIKSAKDDNERKSRFEAVIKRLMQIKIAADVLDRLLKLFSTLAKKYGMPI